MFKILLAVGAACFAMFSGQARAAENPSLDIYGRLPAIEDVEISPSGALLALTVTDGDQRVLIIRKVGGDTVRRIGVGTSKLRGVVWVGDDHVIAVTSQTAKIMDLSGPKREYFMATAVDLKTGKARRLLEREKDTMNVIVGWPMARIIDGEPIAFLQGIHFLDRKGANTLFRVNLKTGSTRMIDGATPETDGWLVNAAGEPVAQSLYDGETGRWSLRTKQRVGWRTVDDARTPMGSFGLAGFGRDGESALIWRTDKEHNDILREYRPDGGFEDVPGQLDLSGLLHDPQTLALLGGYALKGDDLNYTFFDRSSQAAWNAVTKGFPGERVRLASWSKDRKRVVVLVDSPTEGPGYALADLNTKQAQWLGQVYDGITDKTLSPVRSIRYKAADGLEISGYLTLPRGRDPKNLPLIVLPHGGPEGRDKPGFDWWSQALASRGYAVLQPNFRGSEGFGWAFVKAGFGEWGKKMQTDLSDGVRDLVKQGIVDPRRVCIVGASYGGYAALAGATLDPGVYRCAVSVAGPSDLRRMLISVREAHNGQTSAAQRYWLRFMGVDGLRDPDLAAISPAQQVDKVAIPILLIHGKDDTVVRYDQSQIMADALKRAGKPVEFVTLDGEDHWLSRGATRLRMLTETVAFIEKHNPPQ